MQLSIGSEACADCHEATYTQWEDSRHAQAGVACISCHLSHSQDFRLTDEALCNACHNDQVDDFFHTIHATEAACTECHLPSTAIQPARAGNVAMAHPILMPSHDFTAVSLDQCMSCHRESVYEATNISVGFKTKEELIALADQVPVLSSKLESAQESNRSLRTMLPVTLGLGIGIGGIIGIAFILVISRFNRKLSEENE